MKTDERRNIKTTSSIFYRKTDGITDHHHYTGHASIDLLNVEDLAKKEKYWGRIIIEGLKIRKLGKTKSDFLDSFIRIAFKNLESEFLQN